MKTLPIQFWLAEDDNAPEQKFETSIQLTDLEMDQVEKYLNSHEKWECWVFEKELNDIYQKIYKKALPLALRPVVIESLHTTDIPATDLIDEDEEAGLYEFEYSDTTDCDEGEIESIEYEDSVDRYGDWIEWETKRLEDAEDDELGRLMERYLQFFKEDVLAEEFYFEIE